jgi:hypothetical protein
LVNFSRTNGSLGTTGPQRQKSLTRVTNENGPRCGTRAGSMGAAWCGSETEDLETPAVVPPPPPVPTPSRINWVTGRRLHVLDSIKVAGVVNGRLTPIWQKLWTVASEPRPFHQTSGVLSVTHHSACLNEPFATSVFIKRACESPVVRSNRAVEMRSRTARTGLFTPSVTPALFSGRAVFLSIGFC